MLSLKNVIPTLPSHRLNYLSLQEAVTDPTDHQFVERVYCNHLFHYGCLDKYMKTPPFQGII